MTYANYLNRYEQLEASVIVELGKLVIASNHISKHTNKKALKVNIFGYSELILTDGGALLFLDKDGYEFNLFSDATLIDLIELLNEDNRI